MGVLSGLKPDRVFTFFEEIAQIPHGSGNVEAISDYLEGLVLPEREVCSVSRMR